MDFGEVVVGESAIRDLVVRNLSGTRFVNITAFSAPRNGVTISGTVPRLPLTIGPGQELRMELSFAPSQEGALAQTIQFVNGEETVAFADLSDNATLAEGLLKFAFQRLLEERQEDLAFFDERIEKGLVGKLEGIVNSEFVRMDYGEAIAVLQRTKEKFEFPVKWGMDLQSEHERYLTEKKLKRPVILYDYPRSIKPFYMRVNDDEKTVRAMDVLVPRVGEIIGGSQREERLDVLTARMQEQGLDPASYWWYLDLRRYGTVPHSGFGLGLERAVQFVTGMANIRDVIPFPRTPGNADF